MRTQSYAFDEIHRRATGMSTESNRTPIPEHLIRGLIDDPNNVNTVRTNLGTRGLNFTAEEVELTKRYMFDNPFLITNDAIKYDVWQNIAIGKATPLDMALFVHEFWEASVFSNFRIILSLLGDTNAENLIFDNFRNLKLKDWKIKRTAREYFDKLYYGNNYGQQSRRLLSMDVNPSHSQALAAEFEYIAQQLEDLTGISLSGRQAAVSSLSPDAARNARLSNRSGGTNRGHEAYHSMYIENADGTYTRLANYRNVDQWRVNDIITVTQGSRLETEFGFAVGEEIMIHEIVERVFNLEP